MRLFLTSAKVFLSVLRSVSTIDRFLVGEAGIPSYTIPELQLLCQSGWDKGYVITRIRAWWAKFQVKVTQFQFVHYDGGTCGENSSIGLKIWHNLPDDEDLMNAAGHIVIAEASQEYFEAGGSNIDKKSEQHVDAGSGKLLGAAVPRVRY
ncbi:hypothetical protein DM02DRAFT_622447 [Periconia macrospinosa]|uniref:Uncharacterized protein n=1 Tax=Periconia macrospinosa TaxID=97972 RepID=A0A2V1E960_9PLEO|nr:hypothetical protein DM02DRAFT_622447 [Periconia macrospinosa]